MGSPSDPSRCLGSNNLDSGAQLLLLSYRLTLRKTATNPHCNVRLRVSAENHRQRRVVRCCCKAPQEALPVPNGSAGRTHASRTNGATDRPARGSAICADPGQNGPCACLGPCRFGVRRRRVVACSQPACSRRIWLMSRSAAKAATRALGCALNTAYGRVAHPQTG